MPYVHVWDNGIAQRADLAANIGIAAQQSQDDAQAQADQRNQVQQLQAILTDQRDRAAIASHERVATAGQANTAAIAQGRNDTSIWNTDTRTTAAGDRTDKNITSKEDIASGRLGLGYDRLGETTNRDTQNHQDRVDAQGNRISLQQQKIASDQAVAQARLAAQSALQDQRLDARSRQAIIDASVREMARHRAILAQMANNVITPDPNLMGQINKITGDIDAINATRQAPPTGNVPQIAPTPFVPAQLPGMPNVLPPANLAPQVAQPQAAPAPATQPTIYHNPQTGQSIMFVNGQWVPAQ